MGTKVTGVMVLEGTLGLSPSSLRQDSVQTLRLEADPEGTVRVKRKTGKCKQEVHYKQANMVSSQSHSEGFWGTQRYPT